MSNIISYLQKLFSNMGRQISLMTWKDILDILLLTLLFYFVYRFMRDRRAGKLASGVLVVLVLLLLCESLELNAISFLLKNVVQVGLIALLILFQPELRSALETMGAQPLRSIRSLSESKDLARFNSDINTICEAAVELSRSRTGALIVFERETKLGDIIRTGVPVDANLNSYLLRNIFYEGAPLHDGAVVVRDFRICAAACYLPLTQNQDVTKEVGTRHRAAIGMSEASDAVVLCVSEETGIISLAIGGNLTRRYNFQSLNKKLTEELKPKELLKKIRKRDRAPESGEQ
ncbi:MAG: diadenylate cyclase CdaA [Eubacteriales bacterium]|nr:diadenylate cyclase CdaA [Eubacteriales bacterium]